MLKRSCVALLFSAIAVGQAVAEGQAPSVDAGPDSAPAASSRTGDAIGASERKALQASEQRPRAAAASAKPADDPEPSAAAPDPLTPKEIEQGPVRAPGAPSRASSSATLPAVDPAIAAIRSRLEGGGDSRGGDERADLDALKSFYAGPSAARIWTGPAGLTPRADAVLAALSRADDWGLEASAFSMPAPPRTGALPETLIEAEISIGLAVLKYARHARGGRLDPPALSKMIDMRPRPYEPSSVLEAIAAAPAADAYLEGLNPRHAGFQALKGALSLARAEAPRPVDAESAGKSGRGMRSDAERRIIVNMERWRWLPDDLGAFYVWDNVPEQVTRVFHDDKVVLKEKIVVGKPNTPTPMFSAPMRFVIFHPSWGVPEGIKTNELAPLLRRAQAGSSGWFFSESDGASRALRRHELRVYHGGREINPDRVNWASVDVRQFSFTQPPSAKNVLGVVKFRFPNRFDVYMHDTSERHLFSRPARTFSHGCMRVENPLRLAETILAYDKGWGRDRISQLVARGSTTDVTLDKTVPVHIVYFTATVDESGKLHAHSDIYGMDSRIASALWGRSVVLASARPESDTKPEPPAARKESSGKKAAQRVKANQKPIGTSDFNPFSSLSAN